MPETRLETSDILILSGVSCLILCVLVRTMRILSYLALLALVIISLAACGTGTLLSNVGPATLELHPTGQGENVKISYTLGRDAKVSVFLQDAAGARYTLRDNEPR